MEEFANACVRVFCELTGYDRTRVGTAPTPFLYESQDPLAVIQEGVTQPGKAGESAQGGTVTTGITGELASIGTKCLMRVM